jgi:hypothetical protein
MAVGQLILFLVILTTVAPKRETYLSLPIFVHENATHAAHNIRVDINQRLYHLAVQLHGQQDHFLDLANRSQKDSPNGNFQKHPDSLYGLLDYLAHEKVDDRFGLLRQLWLNAQLSLANLPPRQQWLDLKAAQQVPALDSTLSEGSINAASPRFSPFLNSLKRYSPYAGKPVLCVRTDSSGKSGDIYFGEFVPELVEGGKYWQVQAVNEHQLFWEVAVPSISLQTGKEKATGLYTSNAKFKLSLSEKTLQLPQAAVEALVRSLPHC